MFFENNVVDRNITTKAVNPAFIPTIFDNSILPP